MGSKRRGARSLRGREGPGPTKCAADTCFDPLVRKCVDCKLLRTPELGPATPPEPLDNVIIHPPKSLDATAPVWPPPREDPANTPPAHSVPVPATELGSTELVTTKTTGPEQQ
ncbi:tumor necrosis factor receptor superfamily member 13C [Crocuta crocuta]